MSSDSFINEMVSNRVPAWHQLGTVVDDPELGLTEAMKLANLAKWDVKVEELMTLDGKIVPKAYATTRWNPRTQEREPLATVGSRYVPMQNEEAFAAAETFLDSNLVIETAGSFDDGRKAFVLFRMPEDISIGGDRLIPYLGVLNSHDGSTALTYVSSAIRWECRNTIAMSIAQAKASFRVKHTLRADRRIMEAREALDIQFSRIDEFSQEIEKWMSVEAKDPEKIADHLWVINDEMSDLVKFRQQERRQSYLTFYNLPTNDNIRGTAWGALQAGWEMAEWGKMRAPDKTIFDDSERLRQAKVIGELLGV